MSSTPTAPNGLTVIPYFEFSHPSPIDGERSDIYTLLLELYGDHLEGVSKAPGSRRVAHVGTVYSYGKGADNRYPISWDDAPFLCDLRDLVEAELTATPTDVESVGENYFNQCIINEYPVGKGIGAHIDDPKKYAETVASLTFSSDPGAHTRQMVFTRGDEKYVVTTPHSSLYIMEGESRSEWKHSMPARKSDVIGGRRVKRSNIISVTFRRTNE